MKKLHRQFALGCWAAIAVGMGIEFRSWEAFFRCMAIFAFFAFGFAAAAAMRSANQWMYRTGVVMNIAVVGIVVAGALSGVERVYLVNAPSYPTWLASADLGPVSDVDGLMYVGAGANNDRGFLVNGAPVCKGKGAELFHKDNGAVVIRCGGMMWYDSHTYLAHEGGK